MFTGDESIFNKPYVSSSYMCTWYDTDAICLVEMLRQGNITLMHTTNNAVSLGVVRTSFDCREHHHHAFRPLIYTRSITTGEDLFLWPTILNPHHATCYAVTILWNELIAPSSIPHYPLWCYSCPHLHSAHENITQSLIHPLVRSHARQPRYKISFCLSVVPYLYDHVSSVGTQTLVGLHIPLHFFASISPMIVVLPSPCWNYVVYCSRLQYYMLWSIDHHPDLPFGHPIFN